MGAPEAVRRDCPRRAWQTTSDCGKNPASGPSMGWGSRTGLFYCNSWLRIATLSDWYGYHETTASPYRCDAWDCNPCTARPPDSPFKCRPEQANFCISGNGISLRCGWEREELAASTGEELIPGNSIFIRCCENLGGKAAPMSGELVPTNGISNRCNCVWGGWAVSTAAKSVSTNGISFRWGLLWGAWAAVEAGISEPCWCN